jgi:hypothetical protein
MSAALRLLDCIPLSGPTFRPSMRPTLVPSAHPTIAPATEPPTTQRSATVHPRLETAARGEAQNLLAVMRLNAEFLSELLVETASPLALDALEDLRRGIERLEQRFASSTPVLPRST